MHTVISNQLAKTSVKTRYDAAVNTVKLNAE